MINIHSNLSSTSQNAFTLCNKSKFGEKKQGKIMYSNYETLYLIEQNKAQLISKNKRVSITKANKQLLRNREQQDNYLVFKDLRKKGYIVKTGLKFGTEFRVYNKSKATHAKWLVNIIADKNKINLKDFISKNRISHSTGKKLLLAIIDTQKDITYLEVDWKKL